MIRAALSWLAEQWVKAEVAKGAPGPGALPPSSADMLGSATLPVVTDALLRELRWVKPHIWAPALCEAMRERDITTPARAAAFLAQVGHESGGGKWTREIWGPTPAQARYEGRADLGNHMPGDGKRFMGRGLIQITGRANAAEAWKALRPKMALPDFLEWLEQPVGAAQSAAWWWAERGLNQLADAGQFDRITRRINGGFNGKQDRDQRHSAALAALAAEATNQRTP